MSADKNAHKGVMKIVLWSLIATCLVSWNSMELAFSASEQLIDDEIQSVFKEIDTENKKKKMAIKRKKRRQKIRLTRTLPKKKKIKKRITSVNFTSGRKTNLNPEPIVTEKKPQFRETVITPTHTVAPTQTLTPIHTVATPLKDVYKTYEVEENKSKKWGINVFGFYSTGDKINSTNNSSEDFRTANISVEEYNSSSSFGLGLEHSMEVFKLGPVGLGYQAGSTYEFERTVELGESSNSTAYYYGHNNTSEDPTMALIVPYANILATYNIGYAFGGINYSLPQVKSEGNETFTGGIGFQAGIGANIGKWAAVEALYRWVSFDASPNDSSNSNSYYYNNTNDYQSGFRISQEETLDFSSFNLNLKVRF